MKHTRLELDTRENRNSVLSRADGSRKNSVGDESTISIGKNGATARRGIGYPFNLNSLLLRRPSALFTPTLIRTTVVKTFHVLED